MRWLVVLLLSVAAQASMATDFGRVRWLNQQKGYGFINVGGDVADIFLRIENINVALYPLEGIEDRCVIFTIQEYSPHKFEAINVQPTSDLNCASIFN